jgi:hypothetical protein
VVIEKVAKIITNVQILHLQDDRICRKPPIFNDFDFQISTALGLPHNPAFFVCLSLKP